MKSAESFFLPSLYVLPIIAIITYCLSSSMMGRRKPFYAEVGDLARAAKAAIDGRQAKLQPPRIYERPKVDPIEDFKYELVEGPTYRPYKPTFHMTMGLGKSTRNDWIEIDHNYDWHMSDRTRIIEQHADQVLVTSSGARGYVDELFEELIHQQLPHRYPSVFSISDDGSTLQNSILGQSFSLNQDGTGDGPVVEKLRIMALSVIEDLFILKPDPASGKHRLCAFAVCYPNGFRTKRLMGKSVSEIHQPVPLYKEKLEKSVDRFFENIKVGEFVRRFNWNLTTCGHELYTPDGLNSYPGQQQSMQEKDHHPPLNIQNVYLRVERQILTRLPKTRAVIFTVKTFMTPLSQIREEGSSEQLLAAIRSWPERLAFYKRRPYWYEQVCEYLEDREK